MIIYIIFIICILLIIGILVYSWYDYLDCPPNIHNIQLDLVNIYKKLHNALNDNDIQHWACGGTLLGSVRSRKIIPWDDDMDFCILQHNVETFENIDFSSYGLQMKRCKKGWLYKVFLKNCNKSFIDIFPFRITGDRCEYDSERARKKWPNGWFHVSEIFPTKEIHFENITIMCPQQPK